MRDPNSVQILGIQLEHTGGCLGNDSDMNFVLEQRQGRKYDKTEDVNNNRVRKLCNNFKKPQAALATSNTRLIVALKSRGACSAKQTQAFQGIIAEDNDGSDDDDDNDDNNDNSGGSLKQHGHTGFE